MYILKNALRNIIRSKGRNILIGIIVLAIATSSCVALSIKQASATAREQALSGIKITAQISVNREKIMNNASDRSEMMENMQNIESLTIDDLQKYAEAECVEDFYYTLTTAMNAGGKLEPVDTTGIEQDSDDDDGTSSSSSSSSGSGSSSSNTASKASTSAYGGVSVTNMATNTETAAGAVLRTETADEAASSEESVSSESETSSEQTQSEETASSEANTSSESTSSERNSSGSGRPSAPGNSGGNTPPSDGSDGFAGGNGRSGGSGNGKSGGASNGGSGFGGSANGTTPDTGITDGAIVGDIGGGNIDRSAFAAGIMGMQGDFTVVGYSSLSAMTDFTEGTKTITDGEVFDVESKDKVCIISSELATYNNLKVGKAIKLVNPNDEDEVIKLEIVGIYTDSEASATDSTQMQGFSTSQDSANQIYMSYPALKKITNASIKNETVETEEDTGRTSSTALREQESGTYVFAGLDDYEKFEEQATELGLTDDYTISSTDVSSFDSKIAPLETLGTFATYFLLIVLGIGAIVLIVLNIFNIRERKYEIGVLAAIGMKKCKISLQFLSEIFIVTFIAIIIGTGIGATASVPITNALLENQISTSQTTQENQERNFGRGGSESGFSKGGFGNQQADYITSVTSATNFKVVAQLMLVGVILTLAAGCVAIISVLRYDPLKILTMRD